PCVIPFTLEQSEPRAVEQKGHQERDTVKSIEHRPDVLRVRPTGRRSGRLARTTSSSHATSCSSTARYRNRSALSAWFGVDAATLSSTASALRNSVISRGPISAGWRLP